MTTGEDRRAWWRGARGEWLVILQVLLMVVVLAAPGIAGGPGWHIPAARAWPIAGAILLLVGGALFAGGILRLGRGLTPLPYPKDGAALVQGGAYRVVRHPMYSGGLAVALGWSLVARHWLSLGAVLALFVLLDVKSRREERWLVAKHPEYADYQKRVRRLIPFVY